MNISYDILSVNTTVSREYSSRSIAFWIILSGTGHLVSDSGKSFEIKPLDFLRLSPEDSYTYMAHTHSLIGTVCIDDYTSTQSSFNCIRSSDNEQIKKVFLFALDMQSADIPNKEAIMNSLSGLLWNIFLGLGMRHTPVTPLIENLIKIIIENHRDPDFDLSATIRDTGYTPGHLRRLFKEQTGIPPHEFLTRQRIDTAKKYIRESSEKISIRDIADYCGYGDPNYFSKQFKIKEGISPQEYLKLTRQNSEE